jgi:uncharacterized protein (DUF1330 family)
MAAYVVGFYTMWDHSFRKSYGDQTVKLVEKHGGRFLVRPACSWEVLEGQPPRPDPGMVLTEFPSTDAAKAWYHDREYQPLIKFRQTGSKLDLMLVQGLSHPRAAS